VNQSAKILQVTQAVTKPILTVGAKLIAAITTQHHFGCGRVYIAFITSHKNSMALQFINYYLSVFLYLLMPVCCLQAVVIY